MPPDDSAIATPIPSGLSAWIEEYSGHLSPNAVTDGFLYFMFLAFFFLIAASIPRRMRALPPAVPPFLTSLGMLGTFVGIFVGLVHFKYGTPKEIDDSLPALLAGLRMAFITSITGLILSIAFRAFVVPPIRRRHESEDENSGDALDQLVSASQQQARHLAAIHDEAGGLRTLLEETRRSIAGDGDASVVTQLQKVRNEIVDVGRDLRNAMIEQVATPLTVRLETIQSGLQSFGQDVRNDFRDFSERISQISSRELVKALEEVIRDFNSKLTEQFGENFRRLDDSVGKLVVWQEEYRLQMEHMKAEFEIARQGIDQSRTALAAIRTDVEIIPQTMSSLRDVCLKMDAQTSEMERHLEAFAVLRERAGSAIPELKVHLDTIFQRVADSALRSQHHFDELLVRSQQQLEHFSIEARAIEERFVALVNQRIEGLGTRLETTAGILEQRQAATQLILERSAEALSTGAMTITNDWRNLLAETRDAAQGVGKSLAETFDAAASKLGTEMEISFDAVRKHVAEATGNLTLVSIEVADSYKQSASIIEKAAVATTEQASELTMEWRRVLDSAQASLAEVTKGFDTELARTSENLSARLEQAFAQENARVQELSNALQSEHRRAAEQRTQLLNDELRTLDASIQEELTRSLTQMGSQLAKISARFVEDYERLLSTWDRLLRRAETVDNQHP